VEEAPPTPPEKTLYDGKEEAAEDVETEEEDEDEGADDE
jgi:hypothetical protein